MVSFSNSTSASNSNTVIGYADGVAELRFPCCTLRKLYLALVSMPLPHSLSRLCPSKGTSSVHKCCCKLDNGYFVIYIKVCYSGGLDFLFFWI